MWCNRIEAVSGRYSWRYSYLICIVSLYHWSHTQIIFSEGKSFGCLPGGTTSKTAYPRLINYSVSVYLFLKFELELGKSAESNNHGIKENIAFRSYYCLSTEKQQTGFVKNFLETCAEVSRSSISTNTFRSFYVPKFLSSHPRHKEITYSTR